MELYWVGLFIALKGGGFELAHVLYVNKNENFCERKTTILNKLLGLKLDKKTDTIITEPGELFAMYDDMDVCPRRGLEKIS